MIIIKINYPKYQFIIPTKKILYSCHLNYSGLSMSLFLQSIIQYLLFVNIWTILLMVRFINIAGHKITDTKYMNHEYYNIFVNGKSLTLLNKLDIKYTLVIMVT